MLQPIRRRSLTVLLSFAMSIATSGSAYAAAIGIDGTTLIFVADGSEGNFNVVGVSTNPTDVSLFTATPFTILTPACTAIAGGVNCLLAGINLLAVIGAGGNDTFDMSGIGAHLNVFLSGNAGDDTLTGGAGNDILKSGPGNNILIGGPGTDTFFSSTTGGPPDPVLAPIGVPEPTTLLLLGVGVAASCVRRRRRA